MQESFQQQNWEELKQISRHRIKPSFDISITWNSKDVCRDWKLSDEHTNPERVKELVGEIQEVGKSVLYNWKQHWREWNKLIIASFCSS